jgi:hypothetical protein
MLKGPNKAIIASNTMDVVGVKGATGTFDEDMPQHKAVGTNGASLKVAVGRLFIESGSLSFI